MTITTVEVPIEKINPDPGNPRIAEYLLENSSPSKSNIFRMLGAAEPDQKKSDGGTSYKSLKESIRNNGTLINRILLGKNGDSYKVIEGNTRVAIYNDLFNETKDHKWSKIPAEVDDEMDDVKEHAIRLQAHLVGIRQWSPFAKGKYLSDLVEQKDLSLEEIVGICGGRQSEIKNLINAYRDMKEFYMPIVGEDLDTTRFSGFLEIQNPSRKQLLIDHGFTMHDFASWCIPNPIMKISQNEHVRHLEKIFSNPEAKDIFLKVGSDEALEVLQKANPDLKKFDLAALCREVELRVNKMPLDKITQYRKTHSDAPVVDALIDLGESIKIFLDDIQYYK
jgi:hypothetical protein